MNPEQALAALDQALDRERSALITSDAEALMEANQAKLGALRQLEVLHPEPQWHAQIRRLMERNQANGVLLARRQREVRWALRHLGRSDSQANYSADGKVNYATHGRSFGSV